jgi:HEPN domain-containing protein
MPSGLNTVAMPSSVQARRFYRAAKQRFDDALLLLEMERTTAAVYLAGYSVECMLKALILSAVPQAQEAALLARFRGARAHDYEWLLELYAEQSGARLPASVVPHFARVNSWSTDMRYTPGTIAAHEAQAFVEAAIAIMTCNRLRVFRSANTAHLGHRGDQEGQPRVVPSEKYAACRGRVSDGMRMITPCFARALERCTSCIGVDFLLTFQ